MLKTGACVTVGLCLLLCTGMARAADGTVRTEEVSIRSGDVTLAGTLWLPAGAAPPRAGVVLLHDAGAGTRASLEPYPGLLARQGLAVLTYERRGSPQSPVPGLRELAEDGLAAARVLRERVAGGKAGLMGLGQGAWVAVQAAARSPEPGFLVLVSGGGGPVWKAEQHRLRNEGRRRGLTGPELVDLSEFLGTLYDARLYAPAREARALRTLDFQLRRAKRRRWYAVAPLRHLEGLTPPQQLESLRQSWRDVLSYDSTADLGQVRCPVLAVVGEKDAVAPADATVRALSASGAPVTVRVLPGADFLLAVPPGERLPGVTPAAQAVLPALEAWLIELPAQ